MRKTWFFDKQFYRTLAVLALPILVQNFLASSLNMVDTLMIGRVGENEVAAVGIANQFFFLFNLIGNGAAMGCSSLPPPCSLRSLSSGCSAAARRSCR